MSVAMWNKCHHIREELIVRAVRVLQENRDLSSDDIRCNDFARYVLSDHSRTVVLA
jgi:hypothetical protein